jgi:hypothetical protein
MGLSQWIYSLDSHYENSSTISNKCRNILKSCVECIDNIYIKAPEIFTRENFEFIEIEGMVNFNEEFLSFFKKNPSTCDANLFMPNDF